MDALLYAMPLLVKDFKGLIEDPAVLISVPLLALGVLGALAVFAPFELRWPEPMAEEPEELLPEAEEHPTPAEYIRVGLILAVLTSIEVVIFYLDFVEGVTLAVLLTLTFLKFALVVLWFMHLRFDNPLFSYFFTGGLALAAVLFVVVLATLGANLV